MKDKPLFLDPLVPFYQIRHPIDWDKLFDSIKPLDVEIGSGLGEYLISRSEKYPKRNIVGIEQIWERVFKTLKMIRQKSTEGAAALDNIRVLKVDAFIAMERLFADESIDRIFCLFPCPWPKKSHVKYRLFSHSFLGLVNQKLKKQGKIKIVTDFYPYREWVEEQSRDTGFQLRAQEVDPQYNTKFERKWQREGQSKFFEVILTKKDHSLDYAQKENTMKTYKVKTFDPKKFNWKDVKGPISVILKERLFDRSQKRAMIRVVVSEQNLTQHFWISIARKNDFWKISKAEGQSFFPSEGISTALEAVYHAVQGG